MISGNGSDLSLLIANIVAGALVGYITKALAINMLFKEYPIIGGAEIIKDRENLEISMSTLVEEKLIKPSTMLEEFQKSEFKVSFEKLINYIVENTLKDNIKEIDSISHIDGAKTTSNNLHNFLINNRDKILEICIEVLFNNILIQDVLSKKQINNLVDKLITIILSVIFNSYKNILDKFSIEFNDLKLSDIISENIVKELINDFNTNKLDFLKTDKFKNQVLNELSTLFNLLDFDTLIDKIENDLKEKTLSELLIKDKSIFPSEYIINNVEKLLTSTKGRLILKDLLINIINILEELDIPLSSFLTDEIETKILELIEKYLPDLLLKGEEWIALNRLEMQKLINESIETHLESENIIKQIIGNIFAQKLSERYKIIESTIEELKRMAKKAGPDVIKIANRFLNNTNINDIIKYAKKNFLDYDALTDVLIEIILNYIKKIDSKIFDKLMNIKMSEFSFINNLDLNKVIKDNLLNSLLDQLREEINKLTSEDNLEYREKVNKFILDIYKNVSNKKVTDIIDKKGNNDFIFNIASQLIDFNTIKPYINKKIVEIIPDIIKNKTINDVVNLNIKKDIYNKLYGFYDKRVISVLDTLSKEKTFNIYQKTANIYVKLSQNKLFSKQLTDTLINLMVNLIRDNKLLDGKIYIAVKESFTRFSDEELKQEMDSFMGKELQPIKLLGAFLGAIIGILMYYLSFVPNYGKYVTGYPALISYPLAYAVTEIGTNWLAIRMLFKPYEVKRFLGIKLPFTPGVFPKNKKALADSMVNFIDKKLLSKDNMVKILERHQLKWKEVIKDVVSKNNYQVIDEALNNYDKENYDTVSPLILDTAFTEINNNREEITKYLLDEVKNIDLNKIDLNNTKNEINLKIDETSILLKELTYSFIDNIRKNNIHLYESINPNKLNSLSYYLSTYFINSTKSNLKDKNKISHLLEKYNYLLNNKANNIISNNILIDNKNSFINFIVKTISDQEIQDKAIEYFNNKVLKTGLSSKKSLEELFDGKLLNLILKESETLMSFFAKYLHTLAINKKEELTDIIIHDVEKKGIVETMLVKFGGVRNDVKGIIDVLVDNKLEKYLSEKETEIHQLFNSYVSNTLSKIKLYEFGINDEIFDKKNIKKLIKGILNSNQFNKMVYSLLNTTIEDIFNKMTLKEIIQVIGFNNLKELSENFSKELTFILEHLNKNINVNNQLIINELGNFINYSFSKTIMNFNLNDFLKSNNNLKENINNLIQVIYSSETFDYSKKIITEQIIFKVNENLSDIVDYSVLNQDISNMIHILTINDIDIMSRSSKFKKDIKESVKDLTIKFVEVLNDNVEKETKKVIENILVNSLVDSLRVNNREVMEPIDFDSIVRKEVDKMDPARIEALFDFAKPIFRLLVWYGALGGIIGLAVGIFEAFR
ncbi:MAG: DUF445 family protein [Candidatus Sericytochromatia bacterium]